jgi:hypothetical protein
MMIAAMITPSLSKARTLGNRAMETARIEVFSSLWQRRRQSRCKISAFQKTLPVW